MKQKPKRKPTKVEKAAVAAAGTPAPPVTTTALDWPGLNTDWASAVGKEYRTRDRRVVLIVAHVVRVQDTAQLVAVLLGPRNYVGNYQAGPVVDVYGVMKGEGKPETWPRLLYDSAGNFQSGEWPGQPSRTRMGPEDPLDLMELIVGGAK